MGGRNFDAEADEDWLRLEQCSAACQPWAASRPGPLPGYAANPVASRGRLLRGLLDEGLVHPELRPEFERLCGEVIDVIAPRFEGLAYRRIHGDCHRGNILDRLGGGREGRGPASSSSTSTT